MRKCGKCKKLLDEVLFSINPKTQDFYNKCDLCREKQKDYYKANKGQFAKNGKEYQQKNKEQIAEHKREYQKANRPKIAVSHSKHSDIKHNRYTEAVKRDYITAQFLIDTFNEQNGLCYYCCRQMDFKTEPYADHLATVERLDNAVGHSKSNCVVACFQCNNKRQTMEIDIFKNKISKQ